MTRQVKVTVDGKVYEVEVEFLDEAPAAVAPRPARASAVAAPAAPAPAASAPKATASGAPGEVTSPLSAVVVSIDVKPGDAVKAGQTLITLEAMKMNTLVTSPVDGKVAEIKVAAGDGVEEGQVLAVLS